MYILLGKVVITFCNIQSYLSIGTPKIRYISNWIGHDSMEFTEISVKDEDAWKVDG